jgi:hypothetical protein
MRSSSLTLGFMLTAALFHARGALAAGPDVCALLPIATVNGLTHGNLSGVRSDVSEEAKSYGCAYGAGGLVSVSVIRPGGAAAFARTSARYPTAVTVAGLGDKAIYDKGLGIIALFGDTVIDAFMPRGTLTDAQLSAVEKSLILALRSKL